MYFLNKKPNQIQGCANKTQSSFKNSLFPLLAILTLLSLVEFGRSRNYIPNRWTFEKKSAKYMPFQKALLYKHNKYYIGVLYQNQLSIFYKSNLKLKDNYKAYPNINRKESILFKSSKPFQDFDFVWDQHVVAIITKQRFFVVNLLTEQKQVDLQNNEWTLCSIQITKSAIYVLGYLGYFGRIERGSLQNKNDDVSFKFDQLTLPDFDMKMQVSEYIPPTVDQQPYVNGLAQQNTDIQYAMFYKNQSTSIYSCSKINFQGITDCTLIRQERSSKNGVKVEKASFSADCTKAILEFDNKSPLLVIDLVKNQNLASFKQDSNVLTSEFYNYEGTLVMVWNSEMYIYIYEVSTNHSVDYYHLKANQTIIYVSVDLQNEALFMITEKFIYWYNFFCESPMLYYHSVGKCTFCSQRCSQGQQCDLKSRQCIMSKETLKSVDPDPVEPVNPGKPAKNVDLQPVQSVQQVDPAPKNPEEPVDPQLIKQIQKTSYEMYIDEAAIEVFSQGVQMVGDIGTYVIWTLTTIPVASFFLGFINFWTNCSFYVLLDIRMPHFLRTSLTNLFIALNSSMFNSVGFVFQPKLFLSENFQNQKIRNGFDVDFQLSLDFLLINSENLLKCTFSILLYFIICQCFCQKKSKNMQNQNTDSKIKNIKETKSEFSLNSIFMIFGQVISISPLFFLGLMCMKGESWYLNISQKFNLIFFEISIGMLLCVSPFVITFINLDKKFIKPAQKKAKKKVSKKISPKQRIKQEISVFYVRLRWVYTLQCKITLPFFVMLGYVQACLSVNYLIFGLGIYICCKEPNVPLLRRINNVTMALEIFAVNLAMTLTFMIDYLEKQNKHFIPIIGIFCIGTILLGALHQVLNLFIVDILIDFIIKCCLKFFWIQKKQRKETSLSKESDSNVNNKEKLKQKFKVQKVQNQEIQKIQKIQKIQENNFQKTEKEKNFIKRNFFKCNRLIKRNRLPLNQSNQSSEFKQQTTSSNGEKFKSIVSQNKFILFKSENIKITHDSNIFDSQNSQHISQDFEEPVPVVPKHKSKFSDICSEQKTKCKIRNVKSYQISQFQQE